MIYSCVNSRHSTSPEVDIIFCNPAGWNHKCDLQHLSHAIHKFCPSLMSLKLPAFYFPINSMWHLPLPCGPTPHSQPLWQLFHKGSFSPSVHFGIAPDTLTPAMTWFFLLTSVALSFLSNSLKNPPLPAFIPDQYINFRFPLLLTHSLGQSRVFEFQVCHAGDTQHFQETSAFRIGESH